MSEVSLPNLPTSLGTLRDFVSPEGFLHENPYIRDHENPLLRVLDDPSFEQLALLSPIVLSGESGVGKTSCSRHLIAGLWLNHGLDDQDVAVLSGADFYRSHALAVERNSVGDWRDRLLSASIVLIDGLQQLINKPVAQIELRSLIDEMANAGKLLVCTSLDTVENLEKFDASLISRLNGGLSIPISVPGFDARREFLDVVCRQQQVAFMPEAADRLAREHGAVFPALQSAVIQFKSQNRNKKSLKNTVSLDMVEEYLGSAERNLPNLRSITNSVCKYFKVTLKDIKGPSRKKSIVRARSIAIYFVRSLTEANLEVIGDFFGKRDHTTVLHAFRKIEKQLIDDQQTQIFINELRTILDA